MTLLAPLQDGLAALLGLDPKQRTPVVRAMLQRPPGDTAGYWLQIVIATVLATLGLALNSTAVVIGAMLIAPLMRPIVELAMGLATGSAPLVFRTLLRAATSVVLVVIASAVFSRALPFHEATPELLARTAPSLLDLFVAAGCALAGAYAVVIASSDVATTAAGTSIGISLVPPLCTVGYGLSTRDWEMARGASLLFTANVSAIIAVASAVFVVVGFGQVDIRGEERALDDDEDLGAATRIGRALSAGATARLGAGLRLALPLALLASIAVPLWSAVEQMSAQSTIRQRISSLLERSAGYRIVQYSLDEKARPVRLRVVLVGDSAAARQLEQATRSELAQLGVREPAVSVWAVSDASAVSALSARLEDEPAIVMAPAPVTPPAPPISERIRASWPTTAGSLLAVWVDPQPGRALVVHLGAPLGISGLALLASAIGEPKLAIRESSFEPLVAEPPHAERWLDEMRELVGRAATVADLWLCIEVPEVPRRGVRDPVPPRVREAVELLATRERMSVRLGTQLRVEPRAGSCDTTATTR